MRIDFEWDPSKAASNAARHRVSFEDAMTVFRDPLARSILDPDHGTDEERWLRWARHLLAICSWLCTLGRIDADRSAVRIISARRPTRNEARRYREDLSP